MPYKPLAFKTSRPAFISPLNRLGQVVDCLPHERLQASMGALPKCPTTPIQLGNEVGMMIPPSRNCLQGHAHCVGSVMVVLAQDQAINRVMLLDHQPSMSTVVGFCHVWVSPITIHVAPEL
jgi:hypothetical protein